MSSGQPRRARAVVTDGHGGHHLATLEVAPPSRGEVMVQLEASGVCHTDLDSLDWGKNLILGHEGAGTILQVGAGVDLDPGTRVVLNWAIPCGGCFHCSAGRQHLCEREDLRVPTFGSSSIDGRPIARSFSLGTMSDVTVVKAAAVVPIQVEIPSTSACIVGCGVMTGFGSVINAAQVGPGSSVAVVGVGGVGLNVVQAAALSGASSVIAIDRAMPRLRVAGEMGATHQLLADGDELHDLVARVRDLTAGRGADYAFECTGAPGLAAAPLALIRHAGTAVQVSGHETVAPFDLELFEWDKVYINPLYGQCRPQTDIPRILGLYAEGRFRLDEQTASRFTIDQAGDAFAAMRAGEVAKPVIVLS